MDFTKRNALLAWLLFGLITAATTAAIVLDQSNRAAGDNLALGEMISFVIPVAFAFVGGLIISYQPRNVIGLLLMLPGLSLFVLVEKIAASRETAHPVQNKPIRPQPNQTPKRPFPVTFSRRFPVIVRTY